MPEAGKSIVVIPARGGSKRFPRKNIAPLMGRPLLAYAIHAGRRAKLADMVAVSTDDREIADIAREWGAVVPSMRPEELAGDRVTADEAVVHMVRHLLEECGMAIDVVVLIQPTSPFVLPEHIDRAVAMLIENADVDSVTTLARLDHRLHPYNLSFLGEGKCWEFIFPEERDAAITRQSKPEAFQFANLFAARTDTMLAIGRFGARKGAVLVEELFAWDIDHQWQLKVAEFMLENGIVDLGQLPEPCSPARPN